MSGRAGRRDDVSLGTHGEEYGNWMPLSVIGSLAVLMTTAAVAGVVLPATFGLAGSGLAASIVAAGLAVVLAWFLWIRRQYAHSGAGIMDRVHRTVLSHLDFDGRGALLDVGCGSGALAIRAALAWPDARIVGVDSWQAAYGYSREACERNARSEGVAARCSFLPGDARRLDFPDESFDAVVSNYVFHNIDGTDKRALLRESLRVLRRGGAFALNDEMRPHMYGDLEELAEELRDEGLSDVRVVDTATEAFGSRSRASLVMLGSSRMLVGRK